MERAQFITEGFLLPTVEPTPPDGGTKPTIPPPSPPSPPSARTPWFEVADVQAKAGEAVWVPVFAGCHFHVDGFHIGGGLGGYGKVKALAVQLGSYLTTYLTAQGAIDPDGEESFFSIFQYVNWETHRAQPEEWWEYAVGFFSITQERMIAPIPIPGGTELFRVQMQVSPDAGLGEIELTCKDEYYYTNAVQRRRDFTYTFKPQGFTAVETFGGKITVTA